MNHMKIKICTKCGAHLPATTHNFYTKKTGKYGLESECKMCKKYRRKQDYKKLKENNKCLNIQISSEI